MGAKATQSYTLKVDFSKKDVVKYNRNITKFTPEMQKEISTNLKDYFEIFGYASKMKEGEIEADCHTVSDEWLMEQQTEFNFAKYADINEDQLNAFKQMNEDAIA